MNNFNLSFLDCLLGIQSSTAELIGIKSGEETNLLWAYTIELKPDGITGESFGGRDTVFLSYSSIEEMLGVELDVDVDEYGSASYADLETILIYRKVKDKPLKFNRIRV
jgi:hypothetical protein